MTNNLLVSLVMHPDVVDVIGGAPLLAQEDITSELMVAARKFTSTTNCDDFETSAILRTVDLASIRRRLVHVARESVVKVLLQQAPPKPPVSVPKPAEPLTETLLAKSWGVTQPTPAVSRKRITADEPHDLFDRLDCLMLVTSLLPEHKGEINRVCSRLRRESWDFPDDGYETALRERAVELCAEVKRKNLTLIESWAEKKKRNGEQIQRAELLKRLPLAQSRLECVKREDGEAYYSLKSVNPKCDALLVVPSSDSVVIERLERRYIILKSSRSKDANWRLSFHYRYQAHSGRSIDKEVPLESVVSRYKLIEGEKVAEFTAEGLEQTDANRVGKLVKNPLQMGADGANWMHSADSPLMGIDGRSAPAESAIGVGHSGTKRSAQNWRGGRKHGSEDGDFGEALAASTERQGNVLHDDDDRRKGRLEVDVVRVNIGSGDDDGETDGFEDKGQIERMLDKAYEQDVEKAKNKKKEGE